MQTSNAVAYPAQIRPNAANVPFSVKLVFTLFMCVLVPVYWRSYGPTNFLYFCDVALFLTLAAVWLENSLLASMATIGILLPQMLWVLDFICGVAGFHPIGLTEYMFNPQIKLFTRGLSLFHGWLPFLLLFLVYRLGYDRRALWAWTILAWALMLVCYFLMPMPPAPADKPGLPVNINYVYGFSESAPQTWMNPDLYFLLWMVALPVVVYIPTHCLLARAIRKTTPGALAVGT